MDESFVALIFGAVIIVFFAWDQFNRPTYEKSRELTRLIELLAPSDMRQRTVYWRAYMFYAGILLLVYFTLCAYGTVLLEPLGLLPDGLSAGDGGNIGATEAPTAASAVQNRPTTGYTPDALTAVGQALSPEIGADEAQDTGWSLGIDPIVPLTVSLAIVGLAPSVPILQRFEAKIRFAAHRLSGIPTRLVAGSRQMRQRPFRLEAGPDSMLIPAPDWARLKHYEASARQHIDDPEAFRDDLAKIMAVRSWVLEERLQLANLATRDHLAEVETSVAHKVERLIFELDALTGFGAREGMPPAEELRSAEQVRTAWEHYAREADGICADICVLVMLFVEHGVLPTEEDADRLGWGAPIDTENADAARQRHLAQSTLMRLVSDASRYADRDSISLVLWVRGTAAVMLTALVMGMLIGDNTVVDGVERSRSQLGILYMLSAALTYVLALLVAVTYQQAAYQNGAWHNIFRENWARWLPQLSAVFAWSALAALVCHVGYNIYATAGTVGWDTVFDHWLPVLRFALEYEGPAAMRGPALALLVVVVTDAWRAGPAGDAVMRRVPQIFGGTMFVVGVVSRLLSSQVGASARGAELVWSEALPLALRAGLLAGLIGLTVGIYARATLQNNFPSARGGDDVVAPPPRGALPEAAE